jgi:hypothetical protein
MVKIINFNQKIYSISFRLIFYTNNFYENLQTNYEHESLKFVDVHLNSELKLNHF